MNNKCLIVVNKLSGGFKGLDVQALKDKFGASYKETVVRYIPDDLEAMNVMGFDGVAVCGGDGTLHHVINANIPSPTTLYYVPCGTLNEVYHFNKKGESTLKKVGSVGDALFSYVLATGTFTPLGYSVDVSKKQKFKAFAYLFNVLKEYKVKDVKAVISVDGKIKSGSFTLIMLINSPRCFGFNFNKIYGDGKMHLLLIKSPGADSLLNRIKIFFPFFRAFFVGFKKPCESKNITFTPFDKVEVDLDESVKFCADGESYTPNKRFTVSVKSLNNPILILNNKN